MVSKQKRRKRRRIRQAVLRFLAYINGTLFVISACAIDSESLVPFITCCITMAFLFLYGFANGWFEEVDENGTDDLNEKRQTGTH